SISKLCSNPLTVPIAPTTTGSLATAPPGPSTTPCPTLPKELSEKPAAFSGLIRTVSCHPKAVGEDTKQSQASTAESRRFLVRVIRRDHCRSGDEDHADFIHETDITSRTPLGLLIRRNNASQVEINISLS